MLLTVTFPREDTSFLNISICWNMLYEEIKDSFKRRQQTWGRSVTASDTAPCVTFRQCINKCYSGIFIPA